MMSNPQQRTVVVAGAAGLVVAVSVCNIFKMLRTSRAGHQENQGAEMAQLSEESGLVGGSYHHTGLQADFPGHSNADLSTDV